LFVFNFIIWMWWWIKKYVGWYFYGFLFFYI